MSRERLEQLIERFRSDVEAGKPPPVEVSSWSGDASVARELLTSMLLTRAVDLAAHRLRAEGIGHYTICSSGHEGNVVFGRLTGAHDPALLHYRSGAFQIERARAVQGVDPIRDIALSLVASSDDPISHGRHKVFGRKELGILPQTSTIASHVPRALGTAFALELKRHGGLTEVSEHNAGSAVTITSFGDASLNHSTAIGALNAACWTVYQKLKLPLVVVCEDNGLGISVRTPDGWVEHRLRAMSEFRYFTANGWDIADTWGVASRAVAACRETRLPVFFHLRCSRLLGHAGSDADTVYRTPADLRLALDRDPVLCFALALIRDGDARVRDVLNLEEAAEERVADACKLAARSPKLTSRAHVMERIAVPVVDARRGPFSASSTHVDPPRTLAQGVTAGLVEILETRRSAVVFGEDVAKKGGVYGLTKGLLAQFGPARVFNTLLDEQSILGLALGLAGQGFLPIPEIQYLAYVHNAIDQLRGEAATLPFFSAGQYDNPMVLRIASFGYQKGFGGHFHNDNSTGALREIPGLVIAVPARADDALEILRTAAHLATHSRRVVALLEPIALYHTRDLYEVGDGEWLADSPSACARVGRARVYHPDAQDITIATYGNGVHMSLRAARRLAEEGIHARVLDLRWLSPLPMAQVLEHAQATGRLVVVDEGRTTGSVSETIAAQLLDAGAQIHFQRVVGPDSFIPLGDAASLVLPSEDEIVVAARGVILPSR